MAGEKAGGRAWGWAWRRARQGCAGRIGGGAPSAPAKYSHWVVQITGKVDRRFDDINKVKAKLPAIVAGDEIVPGDLPVPEKHPIPLYANPLPRLKPEANGNDPLQVTLRELRELQAEAQQLERLTMQFREYAATLSNRITKLVHTLEDEL